MMGTVKARLCHVAPVDDVTDDEANTFDEQAAHYDERTGIPPAMGAVVARSIMEITKATPSDLIAELGAGTGQIGVHLFRLPVRYVGFDASAEMLARFVARAPDAASALRLADGTHAWPLDDRVAAAVFASRVVHLLDPHHVAREARRVCRPGGYLMLGRVLREPDSIKERLRRRRQTLLNDVGIAPRSGERGHRQAIEAFVAAGGTALGRQVVASWTGTTTANEVIGGWETLSRMGAIPVDAALRGRILADLRVWVRREIGDPDRLEAFHERYAIDIARLPGRAERAEQTA
jgi:SAM-dependent methyltransferase